MRCEDLFGVLEIVAWAFFDGGKILARTFWGVDKNCTLPFLIYVKQFNQKNWPGLFGALDFLGSSNFFGLKLLALVASPRH